MQTLSFKDFFQVDKKIERTLSFLEFFPLNISQIIYEFLKDNKDSISVSEIRLRTNKPIIIRDKNKDNVLKYIINQSEILQILEKICENSIYAYKNQICEGYITIKGGHRVGITGSCVVEDDKIINIKYISSLNFRVAREVFNCSDKIINEVLDIKNNTIFNTIIVGNPGSGKTTILRDLVRRISNGIEEIDFLGKTCGIVDERGELGAMYKGIPQNDLGLRTDVIESVNKYKGIHMLIRSMAPEIIACDEIGSKEDIEAIRYALFSGVKGIFTMHGKTIEDIKNNKDIYELIANKEIEKIVFLS